MQIQNDSTNDIFTADCWLLANDCFSSTDFSLKITINFKYIIIKDKATFLDLCLKIINNDVNYDAVILPYKKFYGMTLPRGLNNEQLTTNIISLLCANHKWKRSIIDLSIVGKGLKPLSDITWYLTNKVYNTPVSSVQSFTESRNMFGYLNDPISSNFIHTLTIHSSIKMDIPKIALMTWAESPVASKMIS